MCDRWMPDTVTQFSKSRFGRWVRYEDYDKLELQHAALRKAGNKFMLEARHAPLCSIKIGSHMQCTCGYEELEQALQRGDKDE